MIKYFHVEFTYNAKIVNVKKEIKFELLQLSSRSTMSVISRKEDSFCFILLY